MAGVILELANEVELLKWRYKCIGNIGSISVLPKRVDYKP